MMRNILRPVLAMLMMALSFASAPAQELQDLRLTFEYDQAPATRAKIGYGDPIFLRLKITNSGDESHSILSPSIRPPKYTLSPRELTASYFTWVKFPMTGFAGGDVEIPANGHVCMLDVIRLPLSDQSKNSFWDQRAFRLEADLAIRHAGNERSSVPQSALATGEVDIVSRSDEQISAMNTVDHRIQRLATLGKSDVRSRVAANQELQMAINYIQPGGFQNSIREQIFLNQLIVDSGDRPALERTMSDVLQWLNHLNRFERHVSAMRFFFDVEHADLPISWLEALRSRLYDNESCSDDCSSRLDARRIDRAILLRQKGPD